MAEVVLVAVVIYDEVVATVVIGIGIVAVENVRSLRDGRKKVVVAVVTSVVGILCLWQHTAELGGRDSTGGGSVNKGRVMLAMYSGCTGIGSGRGNKESGGLNGVSMTGESTSMVSTREGRDESMSRVSSSGDGTQATSRYGAGESRKRETGAVGKLRTGDESGVLSTDVEALLGDSDFAVRKW